MENVKIVRVKTPSTAVVKDFFVQLGWRPKAVLIYGLDSAAIHGIAVDGLTTAGQVGLLPTDTVAWDDNALKGVTIEDKGFTIGQNATIFARASAEIAFLCFRSDEKEDPIVTLDNNLPLRDDAPYGEGKQYLIDAAGKTYNPEFSDAGVFRES